MRNIYLKTFCLLVACCECAAVWAQQDTTKKGLFAFPPEDVLASPPPQTEESVSVASFQKTSIRNSPSVITLITQEEIQKSGARELVDLLRLVAGLDFAQNFDLVMGLGVRGNWAEEGKFLFLLDGQPLNEPAFGSVSFYMRIPVQDFERVEIIRGAGSALYGGIAGLCVINAITKNKAAGNSVNISSMLGVAEGGLSRTGLFARLTQQIKAETSLTVAANLMQGTASNRTVNTPAGMPIAFGDSSQVLAQNLRINVKNKYFESVFLWNKYRYTALPTSTVANMSEFQGEMQDWLWGIQSHLHLSKKWTLRPQLQWKMQHPWWYDGYQDLSPDLQLSYDRLKLLNKRLTAKVAAQYTPKDWYNLTLGGEVFYDYARFALPRYHFYNQQNSISFMNYALFMENILTTPIANVTLGMRADKNSAYQWAFAPRLAVTKAWRAFHVKGMLNYAFKAPTIQNIQLGYNKGIRPEWIRSLEFEAGYQWKDKFSLTANVYDIHIDGTIVYVFDPATLEEFYANRDNASTRGAEFEAKWKSKQFFVRLNHSFYSNQHTQVRDYLVEDKPDILAGFPAHKTTLLANYNRATWHAGITCLAFSEKYTYSYFGANFTDFGVNRFAPNYSLNLHFHYKIGNGWEAGINLYNVTNQTQWMVNAVNAGATPFPEQGREVILRLAYKVGE